MVTDRSRDGRAIAAVVEQARESALQEVLRRHHLDGKKFHNEAVVREVASAVANRVRAALSPAGTGGGLSEE